MYKDIKYDSLRITLSIGLLATFLTILFYLINFYPPGVKNLNSLSVSLIVVYLGYVSVLLVLFLIFLLISLSYDKEYTSSEKSNGFMLVFIYLIIWFNTFKKPKNFKKYIGNIHILFYDTAINFTKNIPGGFIFILAINIIPNYLISFDISKTCVIILTGLIIGIFWWILSKISELIRMKLIKK